MNVAVYARFSSEGQREESITAQLRACREYCKRKKYHIAKEYTDEAYSARSDDRPGFQEMIEDSKLGIFEAVVCHKIDRFSRDRYDYAHYKRILRKARIELEFVEQNLDGSPESIILESVLVGMAEYYSRNLAKEVMKGMRENAYQCLHTGGKPPLGYDVGPDKKYTINEAEADTIRFIFRRYTEEATYGQIIEELNEMGCRTKVGGPFGKNSLHDLLKNKKYVGVYTFGRVEGGRSQPRNSHATSKSLIEIEGGIPAIVDKETWSKAQERLQGRQHVAGRLHAKEDYLLSGLIYCGDCGSTMVGNRFNGTHRTLGKKMYCYYKCNRSSRTGLSCSTKKIKKEWIEEFVINHVKESMFNAKAIKTIVTTANKKTLEASKKFASEIKKLENEKKSVQRKIDNLFTLAEEGKIDDMLRERISANKYRMQEIDSKLSFIMTETARSLLTEAQVLAVMQSWKDAKEPAELKAMLNTFVEKVILTSDDIDIKLKLEIASHAYEGDDLKTKVSRNEVKRMFLLGEDSDD